MPIPTPIRRLPDPPARTAGEPAAAYGWRVFCFLVETRVLATCDAETLDLAYAASIHAVAAPDVAPVARLIYHDVRTQILQTLARLSAEPQTPDPVKAVVLAEAPTAGGAKVPTHPAPIAPTSPASVLPPVPVNQPRNASALPFLL